MPRAAGRQTSAYPARPTPPTPTPTETATPTSTPTAPKPSGPLLESLLTESWWLPNTNAISVTVVAAWQPLGAASQADSYLDLTGNGHNITTGVEPTWTAAAGWTFNGSKYLITDIVHDATNLHSVIVDVSTNAAQANNAIGLQTTATLYRLFINFYGTLYYSYSSSSQPSATAGAGVAGDAILAMTTDAIYVDGTWRKSITTAGPATGEYIQIGGDGTERLIGTIRSIAIYKGNLTASQVAEISDNMATPTETPTPTNTPTATATSTPAATPTPSPTPAPGIYTVELPSGGTATVEASATAGQLALAIVLGGLTLLVLFGELRTIANLVANK